MWGRLGAETARRLSEAAGANVRKLVDAVRTAHGLGIAHRDLKLENVLLAAPWDAAAVAAGEVPLVKLIDWGLAHQHALRADGNEYLHEMLGLPHHIRQEDGTRELCEKVVQAIDKDDSTSITMQACRPLGAVPVGGGLPAPPASGHSRRPPPARQPEHERVEGAHAELHGGDCHGEAAVLAAEWAHPLTPLKQTSRSASGGGWCGGGCVASARIGGLRVAHTYATREHP